MLQAEPQLALAMQQVVTADQSVGIEAIATHKLESLGLVQLEAVRAIASCELSRFYFRSQLGEKHLWFPIINSDFCNLVLRNATWY